jgi:hypothetical protein
MLPSTPVLAPIATIITAPAAAPSAHITSESKE